MIRRILITDDAGRPVPLSMGALPSLMSLAAALLDVPPEAVNFVGSSKTHGHVFHADGEDFDLPDGVLSDAGRAQAAGGAS